MDVSMPESVDLASHHVVPESGIERERLDSYHEISPDEPTLPRPPAPQSKQYAVLVTDDPVEIGGRTERDCYRVVTESLAEPEKVGGEWCWRKSEVVPWTTDLHNIIVGDHAYETYSDRSHEYVVTLFAGVLSREQEAVEVDGGPGTQAELGFTGVTGQ
ncbi:hypothetical protein C471_07601 [Halorubrum saccharovorum DSM 1137]|uniref:Uncharacterized protein n=1 Tax=Halorubrum saccharovorum DSM 1137 TaxID=1227484 RepID=M0DYL7_9EURY|nr:hypothetical protein [Halorubrum saccharovorum]ELZ40630.1 hypothetical protein C471_07601 [Halorubrum saccharovorum DSM 1137]